MERTEPEATSAPDSIWKVILQFIIGVAIIVFVAFGIVFLYVKYYQG